MWLDEFLFSDIVIDTTNEFSTLFLGSYLFFFLEIVYFFFEFKLIKI